MAAWQESRGPEWYLDARLFDPLVRDRLRRVKLEHDVGQDTLFVNERPLRFSTQIELKDGRILQKDIEFPRDQPRLSWAQLEQKFRRLTASTLSGAQADRAIEMIAALDRLTDLRELASALCPRA